MIAVSLHKVVEVREGQNTDMFDKFPYPKVEDQSFSLVYPKEGTSTANILILETNLYKTLSIRPGICFSGFWSNCSLHSFLT